MKKLNLLIMKNEKISVFLVALFMGSGLVAFAQQDTVTAGGDATGSGGTASYSVGQVAYTEASGSGGTANQGVQQPFEIFVLGDNDFPTITVEAIVYPNPTTNYVTLKVAEVNFRDLSFQLFDMMGRLLVADRIGGEDTLIQMESLASATYFLSVHNSERILKTFKIVKK